MALRNWWAKCLYLCLFFPGLLKAIEEDPNASLDPMPMYTVGANNGAIYSINPDLGSSSVITTISGLKLPGLSHIALANQQTAYVTAQHDPSVWKVDLKTGMYTLVSTFPDSLNLTALTLANNTTAYVVGYTKDIWELNLVTGEHHVAATIPSAMGLSDLALLDETTAYTIDHSTQNPSVYLVNLATGTSQQITALPQNSGPTNIILTDRTTASVACAADANIYVVDLETGTQTVVAPMPSVVELATEPHSPGNDLPSPAASLIESNFAILPEISSQGSVELAAKALNTSSSLPSDSSAAISADSNGSAITEHLPKTPDLVSDSPNLSSDSLLEPSLAIREESGAGVRQVVEEPTESQGTVPSETISADAQAIPAPMPMIVSAIGGVDSEDATLYLTSPNGSSIYAINKLTGAISPVLTIPGNPGIRAVYVQLQMRTKALNGNNLLFANYLNANAPINVIRSFALQGSGLDQALKAAIPTRNAFVTYASQNAYLAASQTFTDHNRQRRFHRNASLQKETAFKDRSFQERNLCDNSIVTRKNCQSNKASTPPKQFCPPPKPYTVWIAPFGEYAKEKAQPQVPAFTMGVGGAAAAFEVNKERGNSIGFGGAYVYTSLHEEEKMGKAHINQGFLTLYGTVSDSKWYADLGIWGGYYSGSNQRNISFPGVSVIAQSDIQGWQLAPHAEIGYDGFFLEDCRLKWFGVEPFLMGDWVATWERGFHESGAGSLNMGQSGRFSSLLRGESGLRLYEIVTLSSGQLIFREKASYAYQKAFHTGTITAFLVGSPGSFTVSTLASAQNLGVAEFSMLFVPKNQSAPYVDFRYQGEFGSQYQSHQGIVELGKEF